MKNIFILISVAFMACGAEPKKDAPAKSFDEINVNGVYECVENCTGECSFPRLTVLQDAGSNKILMVGSNFQCAAEIDLSSNFKGEDVFDDNEASGPCHGNFDGEILYVQFNFGDVKCQEQTMVLVK